MSSKYIKFGLRSDRSLSDLENPSAALGNLLNNISTQTDENGNLTGFNTSDLSPVVGIRNTGLAGNVTNSGTSIDLANLNNSLVEYTPLASPTTKLEVQPRTTIQDNINNFKSVLGNPPFINGGDGPVTKFIPSARINRSVNISTKGNASTSAVLSLGNNLYSTIIDTTLSPIIEGEDFWNNGVFELGSKVHPTFPNTYGMIQWTGYLSSYFSQRWESTGLFMIEQDIVDDGTNDNWTTLKNVYAQSFTLTGVAWATEGTNSTISLASGSTDIKSVCVGMKFVVGLVSYEVTSVNEAGGTFTVLGAAPISAPTAITLTWSISDDLVTTGSLVIQEPRTGDRTRVRYTVWWPDPGTVSLPVGTTYRTKRFAFSILDSDRLPFSMIYSSYSRNQTPGEYTYEYFKRNRASVLKQASDKTLRVNNLISLNYAPPTDLSSVVKGMSAAETTVTPRTFTLMDSFGRLEGAFMGCEVGDWLVFSGGTTTFYAYQIEEVRSSTVIYVKQSILTDTGFAKLTSIPTGLVFKNSGLIGIFRLESAGGTQGSLHTVSGTTIDLNNIYPDYIVTGINASGTGFNPLRIMSVSDKNTNPKAITVVDYKANNSSLPATPNHICTVYSSRGLEDLSLVDQCKGVYGREVNATADAGATSITLTTSNGVSVGDFVQFAGIITEGTTVSSIPSSTVVILSQGVIASLNKSSTLIFIKAADRVANVNKEFCVIPLNTAPPFEGTEVGLATTTTTPNLVVKNFRFSQLDLTIPDSKIQATGGTSASKFFPIVYGNTTFKALVA